MFYLLKKFIESNYNADAWNNLTTGAGIPNGAYNIHESYPIEEMDAIISQAANYTGKAENDLKVKFGEYLVPDLMKMYKAYLNPAWKTFEVLENTEIVMHKAVRKEESKSNPPVLNVSRVHDKLIIIDYYSKRKMGGLAVGIIRGIASFYSESDKVHVNPTTDPNEERVQIRIEFS